MLSSIGKVETLISTDGAQVGFQSPQKNLRALLRCQCQFTQNDTFVTNMGKRFVKKNIQKEPLFLETSDQGCHQDYAKIFSQYDWKRPMTLMAILKE